MQRKLVVLFILVLLAFVGLGINIYAISRDNGNTYKKQVLSQQSYDSRVIDYKRGTILDAKGTVLADSELVYDVIIDAKQMLEKEYYLEPSLRAISRLGIDADKIRQYVTDNPDSQYYIAMKNLSYDAKTQYDEELRIGRATEAKEGKPQKEREYSNITGIWFDANYIRSYPNGSLACDVIGFTNGSNVGTFGLEEYYNDVLNGTPGREYGYLDENANLERTTIDATDGNNLVSTIDANVQSIVEKYLKKFNDEHKDEQHNGNGANNVGCVVMNVKTGEILGMGSYPGFDLNDPYNTDALIGMPKLDEKDAPAYPNEYLTADDVAAFTQDEKTRYLNALWRNFCISDYYEPGSVAKLFTVAAGLESGAITGNETYYCEGKLNIGGWDINCHNVYGDGLLTVSQAVETSCNVALMEIAMATGIDDFCKFQSIFNFGLKTNIDLAGEARTVGFIYDADRMGITDLATNSFGQNFNVTMIQMAAGFASIINGGNYYEPHLVSKITSPGGATVRNIEPRILKKTVSATTSAKIREYCRQVVMGERGTGHTARPAGYVIGGKTGTAETIPRDKTNYVVSFMGFAPVDDPQVMVYVVVDRPNTSFQPDAKYATRIVRNVLTEALPYLNIYMTEPLSEEEQKELEEMNLANTLALGAQSDLVTKTEDGVLPTEGDDAAAQAAAGEGGESTEEGSGEGTEGEGEAEPEYPELDQSWKEFPVDPETGLLIDPSNGHHIDPETGYDYDSSFDSTITTSLPVSTPEAQPEAGTAQGEAAPAPAAEPAAEPVVEPIPQE